MFPENDELALAGLADELLSSLLDANFNGAAGQVMTVSAASTAEEETAHVIGCGR